MSFNRTRGAGFTLIELMIVVAVIAVLAVVAYPSYIEQIRKSRRSQAMDGLSQIALQQEKWRVNNTQYDDGTNISVPSNTDYYNFAVSNYTATTFAATATAQNDQTNDSCGNFKIDQAGPVTSDASFADANCWKR